MIEIDIKARRVGAVYEVLVNLGKYSPSLKWDTGAKYTVISARAIDKDLSDEALERIKEYCEKNHKHKEKFISASGDSIYGYLTHTCNAVIDASVLNEFYYYLVLENKREIALLGYDFIDNCSRCADAHGDIVVTGFDPNEYIISKNAIENDELIALIDSLS